MVASLFAIDLPGNQLGVLGLSNKPIAPISPWSAPKNRAAAICKIMQNYAKLCLIMCWSLVASSILKRKRQPLTEAMGDRLYELIISFYY